MDKVTIECILKELTGRDIILFDGSCLLCHQLVRFVLKADKNRHFLLSSQQSAVARLLLLRRGIDADALTTVYVIQSCGQEEERVHSMGSALVYVYSKIPCLSFLGWLLSLLPRAILDAAYRFVALNRYRLFGRTDQTCLLIESADRARVIG